VSTPAVKESFTTADLAIVPPPQASPIVLRGQEGGVSMSTQRCTECGGRGIVYIDDCRWYTCPECGGSGYEETSEEAEE